MIKKPLSIYLADLTHTGARIATENMPLNIGLIAAYARKMFDSQIKVKLFKYPEKLFSALKSEPCNILACSSYIWNNNLTEHALKLAKAINPLIITIRGGWNFPNEDKQKDQYLKKYRFTDIYCEHEGEIAFSNVVERLLSSKNLESWNEEPIEGCCFLKDNLLVSGSSIKRIDNLDWVPSPYLSGLLDEFFDGNLTPIIETARGCPFKCNYCNNSNEYYNKVNFFSLNYVKEEIHYIAQKIAPIGVKNLIIADTNFGMFPRDGEISLIIKEMQEKYKWPLGILVSTGKNKIDRIIENTKVLGNSLTISMSVQSMNKETINLIKRDNIDLNKYEEMVKLLKKGERSQMAELIVPLPAETLNTYMKGIETLFHIGIKRIISYTLQLNYGTVYKNDDFREKYGYNGKYRLIPYDFGEYEGEKIFDFEEVASFSKTLSFEDYLNIRKFALTMEITYNNSIFRELFKYLEYDEVSECEFLFFVLENIEYASKNITGIFASFVFDTTNELKESEKELINFYSRKRNYIKLEKGEIGGNVIFKHVGIMLSKSIQQWIDFVFECAHSVYKSKLSNIDYSNTAIELEAIKNFVSNKLKNLFLPGNEEETDIIKFRYDILTWLTSNSKKSLKSFRNDNMEAKYRFYYNEIQIVEKRDLFKRYGSDIFGVSRILARVPNLERLFRKVERII